MTPFQAKLPGPRCLCSKHRGMAFSLSWGTGPGRVRVGWNGKTIKTFPDSPRKVPTALNAFLKKNLAVQETCIMTVKERTRGNVSRYRWGGVE